MNSGMEPEARNFLQLIARSIAVILVYMLINTNIGLGGGWFFFDKSPTLGNYIFYAWVILSTVLLVLLLLKWWRKKKFPHG
jgi:hypothetical protein